MTACTMPAAQPCDTSQSDLLPLIVKCYDALLRDFHNAKQACADGREDLVMDTLRHAQELLTELLVGLDYERGGEIAVNLGRIYNYMLRELIAWHGAQAQQTLDRMIAMTGQLREAWVRVAEAA
ncbi:flagellar export chaperone FliS [Desulfosoma caldarium]|uniref:Flagellar protein FliS n=1 Tax=Desulfosoma caldarium TaxID=610254 RepID=A0A3N1USE1_9BACT|nr:flagellar protein FliS [Desulfosoma caldarium]ROQ90761.1 flagellar protein FliS [Desulfosoma caldarium]